MTEAARPVAVLVCNNPACTSHRGHMVQIHEDTVLPVHCGGCSAVLHCDHDEQTTTERRGTVVDAYEHTITRCRLCRTETKPPAVRPLGSLVHLLPASVLDQPLEPGRIS